MSTLREAAEMALEVLEDINKLSLSPGGIALPGEIDTAMDLLRNVLNDKSDAQPRREWQELTNEEIDSIKGSANRALGYIRVTAAKLKEKNT